MTPNCPICNEPLERIERPGAPTRGEEWICRNPASEVEGEHHTFYSGGQYPVWIQWSRCEVCGLLHQQGKTAVWWRCYLTDPGLEALKSRYFLKSDGDSFTICRLIEEIQRLRKEAVK